MNQPSIGCPLCGMPITPAQANDVEQDMEFESKSCPVCCRSYAEARREELGAE